MGWLGGQAREARVRLMVGVVVVDSGLSRAVRLSVCMDECLVPCFLFFKSVCLQVDEWTRTQARQPR